MTKHWPLPGNSVYRVPTFLLSKNPGLFQDFPEPPWKIFQNYFVAHKCLNTMCWHHKFKSIGLQEIREQSEQKKWLPFEPMKKCVIFKVIFPGLSRIPGGQGAHSLTDKTQHIYCAVTEMYMIVYRNGFSYLQSHTKTWKNFTTH